MISRLMLAHCCFVIIVAKQPLTSLFTIEKNPFSHETCITDSATFAQAAHEAADFLKKLKKHPSKFVTYNAGLFEAFGVTLDDVCETLEYLAKIVHKTPHLLHDSDFLNKHFTCYRWKGDPNAKISSIAKGWALPPEAIVTTQYRITKIPASHHMTKNYYYPLYSVPSDETHLTRKEVLNKKDELLRFKYTREQIINGALRHNHHTKVLAWLTDQGRQEFAMQGTVRLDFNDHKQELLTVAGNNGKKDKDEYWFGHIQPAKKSSKFPVRLEPIADITYAGDINLLGFGKVIALKCWNPVKNRHELRLGILTDTGNAFKNNLAKLDMFTGYFPSVQSFTQHIKSYPQTARAYILIKKPKDQMSA